MAEKKKEVRVGDTRIWLGEDNILRIKTLGDVDEETVKVIYDVCTKMTAAIAGKVNILIDLNHCGKLSAKSRRFGQVKFEKEETGKVALIGMHPVARVLASFLIGMIRKKDLCFFKTEEEALAWLNEEGL